MIGTASLYDGGGLGSDHHKSNYSGDQKVIMRIRRILLCVAILCQALRYWHFLGSNSFPTK
jgi:hypothetical protein